MLPIWISSHAFTYQDIQHLVGYQDMYRATEVIGLEVVIKLGHKTNM